MKMAKASEADQNMARELTNAIEAISNRWYATVPEAVERLSEGRESESFDIENTEQCQRVLRHLIELAGQASLSRVTFGMLVILDPRNELVDPEADTLELHPKHAAAAAMLKALGLPEGSTMTVHDWSRHTRADADRSPPQYAIEHAEYLAQSSERLLDALNSEDEAHMHLNDLDSDDPEFEAADTAHTQAIESRREMFDAVRNRIYEFRKRTARKVAPDDKRQPTEQPFTIQPA